MNYKSIQSILDAGTTNMTAIRDNVRNDDGTDTLTGVDWFKFNGVVASTIYVSGNTWFGFGANTNQLNLNRRDTAVLYEYREEGTLFELYRFLKIRWSGYSQYNQSVDEYKMTYDVILWDTGDISVHMVDIPKAAYDGYFTLVCGSTTISYSKLTKEQPDVTFYAQNDTGTSFQAVNELITTLHTLDELFLIGSGSSLYTIVDGQLTELTEKELTKKVFTDYGISYFERPSSEDLLSLTDPVLYYFDANSSKVHSIRAKMAAIPPAQITQSDDYFMDERFYVLGIENIEIISSGDVLFAFSFDRGLHWLTYLEGEWVEPENPTNWMDAETVMSIPIESLNSKFLETRRYRVGIRISGKDSSLTSFTINYS